MSNGEPSWAREPIKARWLAVWKNRGWIRFPGRQPVPGPLGRVYQIEDRERVRVEALQRDRARELAAAMGFRTEVTDNHASKIVEVLAPFIAGLTIASPTSLEAVPHWLGSRWNQPKVGAKVTWPNDRKRQLLADVMRMKDEGRAKTDRAALELIKGASNGLSMVSVERLQNILSEARQLAPNT